MTMRPTVLLTGASTGIGAAVLPALLRDHRVVVMGRSRPAGFGDDEHRLFVSVDFADIDSALAAIARLRDGAFAAPAALVLNAGVGHFGAVESLSLPAWQRMMNINVTVPFLLIQACLPAMKRRGAGRIVVVSSDADAIGFAGGAGYCASKHAVAGLCAAVRHELVGTCIGVSVIAPGRVDTCFNGKRVGDRPTALQAAHVADQICAVLALPGSCSVDRIEMRSTLEKPP